MSPIYPLMVTLHSRNLFSRYKIGKLSFSLNMRAQRIKQQLPRNCFSSRSKEHNLWVQSVEGNKIPSNEELKIQAKTQDKEGMHIIHFLDVSFDLKERHPQQGLAHVGRYSSNLLFICHGAVERLPSSMC